MSEWGNERGRQANRQTEDRRRDKRKQRGRRGARGKSNRMASEDLFLVATATWVQILMSVVF